MSALEILAGENIGRDPRTMSEAELNQLGHVDTPLRKIIRAKCLDCSGAQESEVRKCTAVKCALWPYRMNKNPFRTREMTDEQRAAMSERMKRIHADDDGDQ